MIGRLLSTANRIYVGRFGLVISYLLAFLSIAFLGAFIEAPPVDIEL